MLRCPQDIADRTAKHLGVHFYKKKLNEQSLADRFKDATWHCEQPFADLNFIGTYALSELVRDQGFRVLLNGRPTSSQGPKAFLTSSIGQGSDEILGGYSLFLPDFLREPDLVYSGRTIPEPERQKALRAAEESAPLFTLTKPSQLISSPIACRQFNNTSAISMITASSPTLPFAHWSPKAYGDCDPQLTFCDTVNGSTLSRIKSR